MSCTLIFLYNYKLIFYERQDTIPESAPRSRFQVSFAAENGENIARCLNDQVAKSEDRIELHHAPGPRLPRRTAIHDEQDQAMADDAAKRNQADQDRND